MAPIRPMNSASTSTLLRTCRRVAPMARNKASSRARWATRIENVLRISNAATSSAMPAKTSRKVLTKPNPTSSCSSISPLSSSPVSATNPSGNTSPTAWATAAGSASGVVCTHRAYAPGCPSWAISWISGSVKNR